MHAFMKKDYFLKGGLSLIFAACLISCAQFENNVSAPPNIYKVFPPQEVCSYPANVSAIIFHPLGAGTWSPSNKNDPGSGYGCAGGTSVIQILASGQTINIEYTVAGIERGSTMITVEYSTPEFINNETTYRTVFANFANDTFLQAFGEPMSELMRIKILNLASYFKSENVSEETFFMGDGFVLLTREHDRQNSTITVKLKLFPDKSLKLDQTR